MDPTSVAVALIAPYLKKFGEGAASKAGEAAVNGTKALLEMIRRQFGKKGDENGRQALKQLEETPEDSTHQATLQGVLAEHMKNDPEFAGDLNRRVQEITFNRPVGQFLTEVYGGEVGKIVNIGSAGVVHIE
jgi:hypothetical protein